MKVINGNLFTEFSEGRLDAIAHVTNCKQVMGSGVALQVKKLYPYAYKAYMRAAPVLGNISFAGVEGKRGKIVFNLNAQYNYGNDGRRHLNYEAFYKCLNDLRNEFGFIDKEFSDFSIDTLGIPYKMGCDRAGGNWNIVTAMIDEVLSPVVNVVAVKL